MTYPSTSLEWWQWNFFAIRRQRTWARMHYAFKYRDMARVDASYCLDRAEWDPE